MYLVILCAFVAVLIALKTITPRRGDADLSAAQWGYLQARGQGAVTATLVDLYLQGAVEAGSKGTVRRDGVFPETDDPMARAIYGALIRTTGPRALESALPVVRSVATTRDRLAKAGLVLGFWRWSTLRLVLCAVAVLAIVRLTSGPAAYAALFTAACAVIAIGGWFLLSHRTLRGTLLLRRARQEDGETTMADPSEPAEPIRGLATFVDRGGLLTGGRDSTKVYGDRMIAPLPGVTTAAWHHGGLSR